MQLDSTPSPLPTLPLRFGTPLTENSIRVMMLGSGELGKEVVIALQRLGVEVIAVDRYPDAPGTRWLIVLIPST